MRAWEQLEPGGATTDFAAVMTRGISLYRSSICTILGMILQRRSFPISLEKGSVCRQLNAHSIEQRRSARRGLIVQEVEKMRLKDVFQVQTVSGQPVTVESVTVTPQSQALIVRLPIGGFVWNRPTAILVERDETAKRFPIVDITRILQLWLLGFSLVLSIVSLVKFSQRKERRP